MHRARTTTTLPTFRVATLISPTKTSRTKASKSRSLLPGQVATEGSKLLTQEQPPKRAIMAKDPAKANDDSRLLLKMHKAVPPATIKAEEAEARVARGVAAT